jgi:hypothetical protein
VTGGRGAPGGRRAGGTAGGDGGCEGGVQDGAARAGRGLQAEGRVRGGGWESAWGDGVGGLGYAGVPGGGGHWLCVILSKLFKYAE